MKAAPLLVSAQVDEFMQSLPPQARRLMRDALRGLAEGQGDVGALERELSGYSKLKVPPYRVIFRHQASPRGPVCYCAFMEKREVVYEVASAIMVEEGHL